MTRAKIAIIGDDTFDLQTELILNRLRGDSAILLTADQLKDYGISLPEIPQFEVTPELHPFMNHEQRRQARKQNEKFIKNSKRKH